MSIKIGGFEIDETDIEENLNLKPGTVDKAKEVIDKVSEQWEKEKPAVKESFFRMEDEVTKGVKKIFDFLGDKEEPLDKIVE